MIVLSETAAMADARDRYRSFRDFTTHKSLPGPSWRGSACEGGKDWKKKTGERRSLDRWSMCTATVEASGR